MLKLQRILWADDGSKASENVLNISEYFARIFKSEILGVYVNYIFYPITPSYEYYKDYIEKAAQKNKIEFQNRFKKIGNRLTRKRIKFANKIIRGEIVDTINQVAKEKKADLIAIGNTGHGFISRLLIGNISKKILKSSIIPVLTVPGRMETKNYEIKKILVPIDISDVNLNSLNFAIELALLTNSSITVIYVFPISMVFIEYPPKIRDQIIIGIEKALNKLIIKAKDIVEKHNLGIKNKVKNNQRIGFPIRKKYIAGMKPPVNITDYANRNNFDLIVMNSYNKGKIDEFLLGSVTEEVIRNSRCPVLSIRP